jgi:hypothetical protein
VLFKRRVCIISDDGKSSNTHQQYFESKRHQFLKLRPWRRSLFTTHLFGELPVSRISLHVITRFAFLMWLFNFRSPEASSELLSLSQKRDRKTPLSC